MINGWIKIHRSILEWEWWDEPNTMRLFIYCLLVANHDEQKWRGTTIPRGAFGTSIRRLAMEAGLTVQQTRTALFNLQSTHEITQQSTHDCTIITVNNYDNYQCSDDEEQHTEQHNNQHTNNTQSTHEQEKEKKNPPITPYKENKKNLDINVEEQEGKNIISREITRAHEGKNLNLKKNNIDEKPLDFPSPLPPSPLRGDTFGRIEKIYSDYRDELISETDTSNSALMMASGYGRTVTREWLGKMLDLFHHTQLAANNTHDTTGNYRRHFVSWLTIKLRETPKQHTSTNEQQQNLRLHPTKTTGKFSADF